MGCIRNVTGKTSPAAAAALALMEEKKQKKIKAPGAPANFGRVLLFSIDQQLNKQTPQHLNTSTPLHPFPDALRDEAPEEDERAVAPVDGGHAPPTLHSSDDPSGHGRWLHQHRVTHLGIEEGGADKARADVRNA